MKRFASRKFLLSLIGNFVGMYTMVHGESAVSTIIGAAAVLFVNTVYCIIEGCIDAKAVNQITDSVEVIAEKLGADEKTVKAIDEMGSVAEKLVGDGGDAPIECR